MNKGVNGWEVYETIAIGLVNVVGCDACGKLTNYNGLTPEKCAHCGEMIVKLCPRCKTRCGKEVCDE